MEAYVIECGCGVHNTRRQRKVKIDGLFCIAADTTHTLHESAQIGWHFGQAEMTAPTDGDFFPFFFLCCFHSM